jgi:hypothetical protein
MDEAVNRGWEGDGVAFLLLKGEAGLGWGL